MKATERAEIKERKDIVARLELRIVKLQQDLARCQIEAKRQKDRAELWRHRYKRDKERGLLA